MKIAVSGRADIVSLYHSIENNAQKEQEEWVKMLRDSGVKAAHPDDGWVNRQINAIQPCYPQFNDGVEEGDVIALGWPAKYRLVRIVGVSYGKFFNQLIWKFEPVPEQRPEAKGLFNKLKNMLKMWAVCGVDKKYS